jgi:hypothetical protein
MVHRAMGGASVILPLVTASAKQPYGSSMRSQRATA